MSNTCGSMSARNADAGVAHADHGVAAVAIGGDLDAAAVGRVLGGVVEQVRDDLREARRVGVDHQRAGRRQAQRELVAGRPRSAAGWSRPRPATAVGDVEPARRRSSTLPWLMRLTSSRSSTRCTICSQLALDHVARLVVRRRRRRSSRMICSALRIGASGLRSSCASVARNSSLRAVGLAQRRLGCAPVRRRSRSCSVTSTAIDSTDSTLPSVVELRDQARVEHARRRRRGVRDART